MNAQDGDNFFFETNIEFCRNKDRWEPGMNCFYMPYSKCTIRDATKNVGRFILVLFSHIGLLSPHKRVSVFNSFTSGGDVNRLRTYYMGDFR